MSASSPRGVDEEDLFAVDDRNVSAWNRPLENNPVTLRTIPAVFPLKPLALKLALTVRAIRRLKMSLTFTAPHCVPFDDRVETRKHLLLPVVLFILLIKPLQHLDLLFQFPNPVFLCVNLRLNCR